MPEKTQVTELARLLASSRILLSSDISPELIGEADLGLIAAKLIETHMGQELAVVQTEELKLIVEATKLTKAPLPIEVGRRSDFRPVAAEVDSKYRISNTQIDRAEGSTTDFVNYFKDRLHRMRSFLESHRNNGVGFLQNIESIKSLSGGREVCIIGLVSSASTTQKGNILVRLEDETGEANVMFMNGTSRQAKVLFEAAHGIINDEVLAIKGKIATGAPFVYASEIIWPDIPIRVKKETEDDVAYNPIIMVIASIPSDISSVFDTLPVMLVPLATAMSTETTVSTTADIIIATAIPTIPLSPTANGASGKSVPIKYITPT